MNKINEILGEIQVIKGRKNIKNVEICKGINESKYKVDAALKGTGKIEVLVKVYEYCKNR